MPGADAWEESLVAWLDGARNPLQRATAADLATWLPDDLLVKYDRMAMAVSLEGRAPFLQPELVAAALALPPAERMNGEDSKVALRRIAQRWLPERIHRRKKQGFVLPMRAWIRQWLEEHGGAPAYFHERAVPGIDAAELVAVVESDLAAGVQRERLLFALIMLAEWHAASSRRVALLSARYAAA
jgi:asparagine synthase (glutamine-hydrolysing)